jgi:integrase
VSELGPGRWLIGIETGRDPVTGARRRQTQVVRGGRDDAEIALARLRLIDNDAVLHTATNARSVRAACDVYLREVRTERQTRRTDRSAAKRICTTRLPGGREVGDLPLGKLDWRIVEQIFAKWSEEGLHPTTQARYGSALSKVVEHVKRSGWVGHNVVGDARRPKVPTHRPDVPLDAEVRQALQAAESRDFSMYAYVLGMATIGGRRSELLAVRVADVDLANEVLTIRSSLADGGPGVGIYRKTTKRDDWRDVPLTAQMVTVFAELFTRRRALVAQFGRDELSANGYVFSDDPDGATWLRPDTTTQRWLAARGDCEVTFAMLRRYVATKLLDVTGGDYRTVASITGNSEETLRRWYDAGPNLAKKKAVVAMARL